jgi:hypothetical protein
MALRSRAGVTSGAPGEQAGQPGSPGRRVCTLDKTGMIVATPAPRLGYTMPGQAAASSIVSAATSITA